MPNLLAIYGSPRHGGNSDTLLDYFLEGVHDSPYGIERAYLRDLTFSQCTECERCGRTGMCVIQDDMEPFYDKLLKYEKIVMAFPIFFLGPPAIAKAFIDRGQALWVRKYILGRKPPNLGKQGFFLSVGGFKGNTIQIFTCNRSIVKAFYTTCGFKYTGELFFTGIDNFGALQSQPEIRSKAMEMGQEFVRSS